MPVFVLKKGGAGEKTKNLAVTDECEGAGGEEFRKIRKDKGERSSQSRLYRIDISRD